MNMNTEDYVGHANEPEMEPNKTFEDKHHNHIRIGSR